MKQMGVFLLALFMAFPGWAGGDSSDGHTHAAPAAVLTTAVAPRAATFSEDFEIVAAVEGGKLVLYVDHYASNEPVEKATVELEGAGLKGVASEVSPGTYVMVLSAGMPPARHPLTISIATADSADLLSLTLDTSGPAAGVLHEHGWSEWWLWGLAASLLAGAALLVVQRNRKNTRLHV